MDLTASTQWRSVGCTKAGDSFTKAGYGSTKAGISFNDADDGCAGADAILMKAVNTYTNADDSFTKAGARRMNARDSYGNATGSCAKSGGSSIKAVLLNTEPGAVATGTRTQPAMMPVGETQG